MWKWIQLRRLRDIAMGTSLGLLLAIGIASAAEDANYKTLAGVSAYFGILPAELVKGPGLHSAERPMHGRIPKGPHEFHLVVALFEAGTGVRISDATVTAKVSGLGLSGASTALQPMKIADTMTYGTFFNLTRDLYTIKLTVQRPGAPPVAFDFRFDHRR